jgi:ubiquinone/menaquinone biosynthesis C-methylase UbiE
MSWLGLGRNHPFYPPRVRLTGIDLSAAMLTKAQERALSLGHDVTLRIGDAYALDFPYESFDSVGMTLALCTIPDVGKAIAEAKRVLRPGGRLILLEHVGSPVQPVRLVQRLLDPLLVRWKGDHLMREPLEPLNREGSSSHDASGGSGA